MKDSWTDIRSSFLDVQLYRTRRHLRIYSDRPRKGTDMGCLGVHFALKNEDVLKLKSFDQDFTRLAYLQEELEEAYFGSQRDLIAETDKAWDAIHRSLTDGRLGYDNGTFPLGHVILGGEVLYSGGDYIMSLKAPIEVKDIAAASEAVDEQALRSGYHRINASDYGFPLSEEDFQYTWEWFATLKMFYQKAAAANRFVLFTADQ